MNNVDVMCLAKCAKCGQVSIRGKLTIDVSSDDEYAGHEFEADDLTCPECDEREVRLLNEPRIEDLGNGLSSEIALPKCYFYVASDGENPCRSAREMFEEWKEEALQEEEERTLTEQDYEAIEFDELQ